MKKYKFIRFGGLSSVLQKGYNPDMPTFHSPPARRGIYALPYDRVEYFIVPVVNMRTNKKTQRELIHPGSQYVRDSKGKKIILGWDHHCGLADYPQEVKEVYCNPFYDSKNWESNKYKKHIYSHTFWKGDTTAEDYEYEEHNFSHDALIKLKKPKSFDYNGNIWCHLDCYVPIKRKDIIKQKGSWILLEFNAWLKYYTYAKEWNKGKVYETRNHDNYCWDYFEVFIEKV